MQRTSFEFFYKWRGVLMAPIFAFMLFCHYAECEGHWVFYVAWTLFGVGFGIRVWAQMHLHYRLKVHKVLTRTGPYRFVRNPIYIANTLILLAACVMSELVWLTPLMLAWCMLVYALVVRHEERHLTSKYGEPYLDFMKAVPRWFPRGSSMNIAAPSVRPFLFSSMATELYCFLYVIPFVVKELISDFHLPLT